MKLTKLLKSTNLLKLIAVLCVIAVIAIAVTVTALYRLALEHQGQLLAESINNQVALMHTMQQLEENETERDENAEGNLIFNAIKHMQAMNQQADKKGHSIEYEVAKRDGDQISFLLARAKKDDENFSVPFSSELAEPMHRALSAEKGTVLGLDYRGAQVLAAYQYMPEYGLGIVAKIDIDELLIPYLLITLLASVIAIVFIFIGAYAFAVSVKTLYAVDEQKAKRLRKQHEIMSLLSERNDADPCNMQTIFDDVTKAACEGLNSSRASIWMYSDDHGNILCADAYDRPSESHEIDDDMIVANYPVYFKALESGPVIVDDNAISDPRTSELVDCLKVHDTRALLNLSIWAEGKNIGYLCNQQTGSGRQWTLEDQNFARSIADHIAMAMTRCQRNKAEQQLKESEERYELAVNGSTDGLWDWDMKSNKAYRSPQYKKLLGYENNELSDDYDTWLKLIHPADRKHAVDVLNAHLENAAIPYDVEFRLLTKSGKYRWFRGRGNALRDANGQPYRMSGSVTDIDNLKYIESKLGRFKQTLDETSDNIYMFDPDTLKFFYVNKSATDSLGYTEEELLTMTPMDIKPEYNEKTFREMLSILIARPAQPLNFETLHQQKNGGQIPVEVHLQYIAATDTSPRFVAISHDISERKNAEIKNYIQRTLLEHIHQVQNDFISGIETQVVFEKLLNGFLDITESEYGLIGEVLHNADNTPYLSVLHVTDVASNGGTRKRYENLDEQALELHNLDNLMGSVICSVEPVISNKPSDDRGSTGLPDGHPPISRFMGIPLKRGDNLIGVIGIANSDAEYTAELREQLQPLLSTCANLIEARRTDALRSSMENALRVSEEKASTVLATVADGIITIDEKGTVESFNPSAEYIFGYTAAEVIGNNVKMLMPEPYHSEHDGYLEHYKTTGEARIIGSSAREVDGKRKDGTVFPMELSVSEMHSGLNRRFTGVVRDISDRKQVEIALIAAKEEAERSNRTKSEFLSSMSHELRTPLNAIMGFAQLLQFDTNLPATQKKHVTEIYNAGNLLLELINDVLDLAKIEADHIDLSIETVKLEHVLEECFKLIRSQAAKYRVKLSYETSPSSDNCCKDIWVRADNTRFKQVLLNLLSNAIKYNRKGGSVHVCCPPVQGKFNRICITDSGRGISKEDINQLFQPFNRLGAERSKVEGTGIGLVITRKLVELMGGSISVESEVGKGTSFLVDLPAAEAVAPVSVDENQQSVMAGSNNNKHNHILVAEDNLTNQELFNMQLSTLGYSSDIVANGKEAVAMLQKHDYDLLLTDIHMPEMNGYELTRAVRASENSRLSKIPIIAITANAAADEAAHCIEKGMNDYLSKPVDINKLQAKLNQWLPESDENNTTKKIYGNHRQLKPSVTITPYTKINSPIDPDTLSRYVGSDPGKHRHFLSLFLDTAPETILAMHDAHKQQSCSDVKGACHKLKSSARAVGAIHLSTLCQSVETAAVNEDWGQIDKVIPEIDAAMSEVETYIHTQLAEKEEQPQVQFSFDDVLIIDDDRFVRDLVTSRLNNIGINNVMAAESGEDALQFMKNSATPPSVLLLDLNMPGMDGVEFLRHLAEMSFQGNIILISGEDARLLRSAENIAKDRNLNILGALEKPVMIPALTELLLLVGSEQAARPSRNKISLTEDELRNSIKNDELIVYYQPQIDIANKQLSGVEALVRWLHPQRGMIPPNAFIPVAEEFDLINDMTDIIMNKAMKQCASWNKQGLDINLSINISVDSLERLDLPEHIVSCAKKHKLDVSKIMLEITESRLMKDITSAMDILTRLSLKGIRLSIDDFGTGYSSMEQLQRIPFSELKIDQAFVNGATHNKAARAILESSIELAQKLNMTIVAEGVENKEDWDLVANAGCTYMQGYYVARPMPGDEIMNWHKEWKTKN